MRLHDDRLILGVAAGFALAVTLVVTRAATHGTNELPAQQPLAADAAEPERGALELSTLHAAEPDSAARTPAAESGGDDIPALDAERRRDGRRREAELLAEFQTLRKEQGDAAFERALREALASRYEPQGRKVAGLRALHAANLPGTVALLAAAAENQSGVTDGSSVSVPRCAIKLLFERAPDSEEARRALARIAFVENARISADLRRSASTSLAASIHAHPQDEAARLLRLEAAPGELAAALQALARDPNFGAPRGE